MPARARLVFHAASLSHHLVAVFFLSQMDFTDVIHPKILNIRDFADRYATSWNFALQMVWLALAVICDMEKIQPEIFKRYSADNKMRKVNEIRDFLFTTFVFPFSIFVCLMFWTIYLWDREMVFPKVCDDVVSPFVNHAMHTTIVPVVLLELFMSTRRHSTSHRTRVLCISTAMFIYTATLYGTYIWTGRWIYDLFAILNVTQRAIFFLIICTSVYTLYFLGCHVDELLIQSKKKPNSSQHIRIQFLRQLWHDEYLQVLQSNKID